MFDQQDPSQACWQCLALAHSLEDEVDAAVVIEIPE